jgi:predicted RNA-binding protein associated with RNAse of E/G family
VIVTLSDPLSMPEPMLLEGDVMLEHGSLAVWFTFPGMWHDIGRFHRSDGTFSGLYANILTPPELDGSVWRTTDLFLDVWWPTDGAVQLLDEEEFEEAIRQRHLDRETAARARAEAEEILRAAAGGAWPPPVVEHWTLERSLEALGDA